jgi:hypothetical protein
MIDEEIPILDNLELPPVPVVNRIGISGPHIPVNQKDEWLTPQFVIDALGGYDSFDLDPCAPIERPWPMARSHYTIEDNGLIKPWFGRVWLNPPYGGPSIIGPWLRRMVEHNRGVLLTFARTETDLFFKTVWEKASAILFIRGRLFFHHLNGQRAASNSGAPSCLIAYGKWDEVVLRECKIAGHFVKIA